MRCQKARTKQLELPLMKNNFIARIKEILKLIDMVKARVSFFPEYNPRCMLQGYMVKQIRQPTSLHISALLMVGILLWRIQREYWVSVVMYPYLTVNVLFSELYQ